MYIIKIILAIICFSSPLYSQWITPFIPPQSFIQGGDLAGNDRSIGNIDNFNFSIKTFGEHRLHINGNGNVGIGTTMPTTLLHLAGQIRITGGNPALNRVLTSNADGVGSWTLPAGGGFTDVGATVILTNINDDVGIGESSPDSKLHITNGGSAGTVTAAVNTITTFESPGNGYLSILTPNANERGIFFGEPSSSIAGGIIYNSSDTPDGFQFRTVNNVIRMVIEGSGGNVGIGTLSPNSKLEVIGDNPGNVGGFPSGGLQLRGPGTTANSNAVITGHNSFNGNTQLWYLGNTSSSNQNVALINRQNAEVHFHTNDAKQVTIEAAGNMVLEQQIQIKGGSPALNRVLTSDASGIATWTLPVKLQRIEGQFSGLNTQVPATTTPIALTFEANDITLQGLSHSITVDPSEFTANIAATYTWQLAPQWQKTTASGTDTLDFFIQVDTGSGFTTVTNSNVAVISNEIESNVIFLSASIPMAVGDKIRFMFRSSNPPNLQTVTFPARGIIPVTPSQILNVFSGN